MSDAPDGSTKPVMIFGRSTSHFTRVATMFAHELSVPFELVPLLDLRSENVTHYGGNPALKIPSLQVDGLTLFGTDNVCRALAERAPMRRQIVWPEDVRDGIARNAQELAWHGMDAQVQLVAGPVLGNLPADNGYLTKARLGFEGALGWLDLHLEHVVSSLPPARDVSFFEVMLLCLVEHLAFRPTLPLAPYPRLTAFAAAFGARSSAQHTVYRLNSQAHPSTQGSRP
jgi:glutathione S-transferase